MKGSRNVQYSTVLLGSASYWLGVVGEALILVAVARNQNSML